VDRISTQTASTELVVGGQLPNRDVYVGTLSNNKLASRESVTGSFGEGFRTGTTAGYRFNTRLGVEMGVIIILVIKQWHKQQIDLFRMIHTSRQQRM
jgi:hypothetical protein